MIRFEGKKERKTDERREEEIRSGSRGRKRRRGEMVVRNERRNVRNTMIPASLPPRPTPCLIPPKGVLSAIIIGFFLFLQNSANSSAYCICIVIV